MFPKVLILEQAQQSRKDQENKKTVSLVWILI